jgi:primase-polymerase (primpol)-like protein
MPIRIDHIPAEMRLRPHWVNWKQERGTKVPLGSSTDPSTWAGYEAAKSRGLLGFVFAGDGVVGVDLDSCRDPESGELRPEAMAMVRALNSYTEVSPSGTGVKVFLSGTKPSAMERCKWRAPWRPVGEGKKAAIEVYDRARFFTVTGQVLPGFTTFRHAEKELVELLSDLEQARTGGEGLPTNPVAGAEVGDDKLVQMLTALPKTARTMAALWHAAEREVYGGDESKCDFALLCAIARLTADAGQVQRVFEQSQFFKTKSLDHVNKWRREDYRQRSLEAAVRENAKEREGEQGFNFDLHRVLDEDDGIKEIKVPLPVLEFEPAHDQFQLVVLSLF